ncbi:MAG: DUF368 domain-containing protein [Bacillota bacterium]
MWDLRRWLLRVGAGWVMGLAVVIPGVSAGTVALLLGVYPEWVRAMSSFEFVRLMPMILGLGCGILSGVQVVGWGMGATPDVTSALFLGIMIAAVLSFLRTNLARGIPLVAAGAACGAAWWLTLLALSHPLEGAGGPSGAVMAGAGAAGGAAMMLPGVSGGTVLLAMGLYHATVEMVVSCDLALLGPFAAGALAGIVLISRAIRALMARWESAVAAVLTGLMIGSMRALIPAAWSPVSVMALGAGAILSSLLLFGRGKWFRRS